MYIITVEAIEAPMRVAMSGRAFITGSGTIIGRLKQWEDNSQPTSIAPILSRIRGL